MEAMECIRTRRSVRRFTDEGISDDVMRELVEAASCAPSWKNTQVPRYTLIRDVDKIREIARDGVLGFAWNTKLIEPMRNLVVVSYVNGRCGFEKDGSYSTVKGESWQMFDSGISAQTFCLAAWDKGIGTVIMGLFDEKVVAEVAGLPENETAACLIGIGYPDETPMKPKRKDVEQLYRVVDSSR